MSFAMCVWSLLRVSDTGQVDKEVPVALRGCCNRNKKHTAWEWHPPRYGDQDIELQLLKAFLPQREVVSCRCCLYPRLVMQV